METRPGATAYTAVPSGAETSTPVWNELPPWSPIRGSRKNPRTGCCLSNGCTGHGYPATPISDHNDSGVRRQPGRLARAELPPALRCQDDLLLRNEPRADRGRVRRARPDRV